MNARTTSEIIYVRCCRVWPVVYSTTTVSERGVKKEYWGWRNCGYCGNKPWERVDEQ